MVERFDFTKLQEDETYIYTDKSGNLRKGMDLTVTWLGNPDKTVLITASQRYESMQRYYGLSENTDRRSDE